MRVLFVHRTFPGHYPHLARVFAAAGDEVVFIHAEGEGEIPGVRRIPIQPKRAAHATTHHYLQGFETAVLLGQAAYRAASQLSREGFRPDVICAHAGFGPGLFLADAYPGVPLLGYFEWYYRARGADADYLNADDVTEDDELRIRTRNARLLMELVACSGGVVPTQFQRDQFPPEFRDKLTVLHDGVDTNYFRPADAKTKARPPVDLPPDAEIVTYATRGLEPYRGFPQFMSAIALLQESRPRLHAVVLGQDRTFYGRPIEGGYKAKVLAELPTLDQSRVHFPGFQGRESYRATLQASDAHVYLTVPFVLSWSLLDSMAAGCAIVGSDTAPVRELIAHEKTGILADLRSPPAIAAAIARLLDDRKLAKHLGAAARRHVVKRYALNQLLKRQIDFVRKTAGVTKRPRSKAIARAKEKRVRAAAAAS